MEYLASIGSRSYDVVERVWFDKGDVPVLKVRELKEKILISNRKKKREEKKEDKKEEKKKTCVH